MDKIVLNLSVGSDNGNSEHDLIINDKLITQPNVYSRVRKLKMMDEVNVDYAIKNIENNLIATINSPSAEPGIYYSGNYALNSSEPLHNMDVLSDKTESEVIIVNTLNQIAGYAVQETYNQNPQLDKELELHVDMTCALPITQYTKARGNKLSEKFMLNGEKHKVTVHVGTKRVHVDIIFEFVKVLPESVPIVFFLQSINKKDNEVLYNGLFKEFTKEYELTNLDGNYFKNKRILHMAIGEGTTEYPLTTDIVFNPNFIKGSGNGQGHAIERVKDEFAEEYGLRRCDRQKFSSIIRDKSHKYHETAMEYLKPELKVEAEDILRIAKKELQNADNEADIICVHGGGSILMREYLEPKLKALSEKANIQLFYIPKEYAVTLECRGMYEFTKGKIFKKIKNNYIQQNKVTKEEVKPETTTKNTNVKDRVVNE